MRLKVLLLPLFFVTISPWAVTTFTLNEQTELEIEYSPLLRLQLQADVSQPGNTLRFELFIDANKNGNIEPDIDADFSALMGKLRVTDGGKDVDDFEFDDTWLSDQDGVVDGQILALLPEETPPITHPAIIRATDQDGSTAEVRLTLVLPKKDQAVVGKVEDEANQPVSGVIVFGFGGLTDLGFPELDFPELEIEPIPYITTTDTSGRYRLPVNVGLVMISVFPSVGYYLPGKVSLDPFGFLSSTQQIKVTAGEEKTGIDYVLKKDSMPPVIDHRPNIAPVTIGNPIRIVARITDTESGIFPPVLDTEPKVYFRPAGSQEPFRIRYMEPFFDFDLPFEDFEPEVTEEINEPELGNAEKFEAKKRPPVAPIGGGGEAKPAPWLAAMRQISAQMELPPVNLNRFKPEEFVAVLNGADVTIDGVEYHIWASDNAGNWATHPVSAPRSLHKVLVKPSELQIQGQLKPFSGQVIPKANIFASLDRSDDRQDFERSEAVTESKADGTYLLHLPVAGLWRIFVELESPFYVLQPDSVMVEVPDKSGQKVIDSIDFILETDTELPKIVHDPKTQVEGQFIGDNTVIRAEITDNVKGYVHAYLEFPSDQRGRIWADSFPDGQMWTFTVPGHLMLETFTYQIHAVDTVGNLAESKPHTVTLKPPPYRVVGRVTDTTGQPIPDVAIELQPESADRFDVQPGPPAMDLPPDGVELEDLDFIAPYLPMFRQAVSDEQGKFQIYVSSGTWHVNVRTQKGQALMKKIAPLVVEAEGEYPLDIVLIEDTEKPVIVHQAEKSYNFDHQMILEATVTDNLQLAGVYLRIFYSGTEKMIVDSIGVEEEPESMDHGDDARLVGPLEVEAKDDPFFNLDDLAADADFEEVELGLEFAAEKLDDQRQFRQQDEVDIPLSGIGIGGEVDLESELELWRPDGYFDQIPMSSADGQIYRIDLSMYLPPLNAQVNQVQYIIEAIDTAGNISRSPAEAPETIHIVSVEVNQWIFGQVVDPSGNPLLYFPVFLQMEDKEHRISTHTEQQGQYRLPAPVGTGQVEVGFGFDADDSHLRQVEVKEGQSLQQVNFTIKIPVPTFDGGAWETDDQLAEASEKSALPPIEIEVVDVVMDGAINIFDLVLVAKYFGQSVDETEDIDALEELASADVNMDGQIDIFDLTAVATRFGESLEPNEGELAKLDPNAAPQKQRYERIPSQVLLSPDVGLRPVIVSRHQNQIDIALELENNVPAKGIQFDLSLRSPSVRLLSAQKGNCLSTNSFWHLSVAENNRQRIAGVALPVVAEADFRSYGRQVVLLSIDVERSSYQDRTQLLISGLHLVTTPGDSVVYRDLLTIDLDLEAIIQPQQTELWQNYPNPFNPETWMPFQISEESVVNIHIYTATGEWVRTVGLGLKTAGIYANPSRAAYWNGKNTMGETVTSGIYYYAIDTGTFHQAKRMVILK
ncbi:hypothetical protein CMK14_10395 [Candidatus Poribacteria bacterium]|nr:hypothetical protein [Candidatus Poribacteria bacterium]